MPATLIQAHLGQQAWELIEAHGRPYTQESSYMRRGLSEKWEAKFLDHEVGGTTTPLDLEASLEAMQAQGFEADHLPFEPTLIRFAGKVVSEETPAVNWSLFAEDKRFGVMSNYHGHKGKTVSASTMTRSTRDHYHLPNEPAFTPELRGQKLAVVAVMLNHVALDLAASHPQS
jgi:hypothetical protein